MVTLQSKKDTLVVVIPTLGVEAMVVSTLTPGSGSSHGGEINHLKEVKVFMYTVKHTAIIGQD